MDSASQIDRLRHQPDINRARRATRDIGGGFARWRLWGRLGWQDITIRYRRSVLGPFWLTLSMGVMVATIGTVYSTIFKTDMHIYLPYLALGFLIWGFITTSVTEGCQCFIEGENFIRQLEMPLAIFVYRVIWRNLIILAHNAVVYLVVVWVQQVPLGLNIFLAVPGLLLLVLNATWVALLFGMLSARFRDIPQIIGSLIQVVFYITPIIWMPSQLTGHSWLVVSNPVFHVIDVVRAPLLGQTPQGLSWLVTLGLLAGGVAVSFALFCRYRGRIAYWV